MSDLAPPDRMMRVIADWGVVRAAMIRRKPDAFAREEWGYLLSFLDPAALLQPWREHFAAQPQPPRPREPVAVWTPNNVSLLGPLVLVLLSLPGGRVRVKSPLAADDLTGAFLDFARAHAPAGPLAEWLAGGVEAARFDRTDARNAQWAAEAEVRIVFGSDEACAAINALPHPVDSVQFSFGDHRSVAWIEDGAVTDEVVDTLVKVFAVYGQAGCTSPSVAVLLGGSRDSALALRDRMIARWPLLIRNPTPWHTASAHTLAFQWARANGWDAAVAPGRGSVLAVGEPGLPAFSGPAALPITWAEPDEAVRLLPANLQTIGHALRNPADPRWAALRAAARPLRWVPLAEMHHFSHVWDGLCWWEGCWRGDTPVAPR